MPEDVIHQTYDTLNTLRIKREKPTYEVCIDSVGPFPVDKDGYKHIIVIIDSFTRYLPYLTLHRSVDTSAKAAGESLFNHCCTYGVSKMIHTDNGA
jgi:hypothetical protein